MFQPNIKKSQRLETENQTHKCRKCRLHKQLSHFEFRRQKTRQKTNKGQTKKGRKDT